ncbi:MAG: leucine-rich repeat domain-containing protein [Oscillospiraceae bacterium]
MKLKRILAAVTAAVVAAGSSVVAENTSLLPSLSLTASAEGGVAINETNFPDKGFRGYVSSNIDKNSDGILSNDEINNCTEIDVRGYYLENLTGIEYFTALTLLDCSYNMLTSLDISKNTELTKLYCYENQLTSLDISNNTALTGLSCHINQLKSLDVSKNTALTWLYCHDNQLTSLDVSKNTELTELSCSWNQLTSLDISNNTALTGLSCHINQLKSLDVSKNTALTWLYCHDNQLTSLDVSNCTALKRLYCNHNQLTSLDVSNCTALEWLYCYNNQLTSLDVSNCTALTKLECDNNQLTSLNVSKNTLLTELNCDNNQLTNLDVSKNTELEVLYCNENRLTSLDVSKNTVLTPINCNSNSYELSGTSLNELTPYGFDPAKASNWTGADYNTATNSLTNITADEVTYVYDVGNGKTATFTLIPAKNIIPENVKATAGVGKVTLTWDAVSGATKYRVQRLNGSTWATVATPTTAAYTDTNVVAGTTYSYRVLSYVDGAWSGVSAVAKATPVSTVPQNVKATAGDKSVTVTWSAVSGATKYRVQRLNGSTWTTVAIPTTTTYTDTTVTNGTSYSYRVLSYVDGAWSGVSAVVTATPKSATTVPQNVKATAGDKSVTVTWSEVDGAEKYRVQRLNGSTWATIAYPTTTTYTDTTVTNGTSYSYRVLSYVDGAWSGVSAVVSATPKSAATVPQNVKAAAGDGSVTVTWSAVSGATKYRVQRLNGSTWVTVAYPTTTAYTDTAVTNGTTYSYRVLSYVDGAWSGVSAVVSATPKA